MERENSNISHSPKKDNEVSFSENDHPKRKLNSQHKDTSPSKSIDYQVKKSVENDYMEESVSYFKSASSDLSLLDDKKLFTTLVQKGIINETQKSFSQYELIKIISKTLIFNSRNKDEDIIILQNQYEELKSKNQTLENSQLKCKKLEKEIEHLKEKHSHSTPNREKSSSLLMKKYRDDIEEIHRITNEFYENYLNLEVDDDT